MPGWSNPLSIGQSARRVTWGGEKKVFSQSRPLPAARAHNDRPWGFCAVKWNSSVVSGDDDHDWLWWADRKERLERSWEQEKRREARTRKRKQEEKNFHGLGLPLLVNRITTALECGHPLFEGWLINNYLRHCRKLSLSKNLNHYSTSPLSPSKAKV